MDSIDFDNVKAEKANALRRFHTVSFLFRTTEICAALLFVFWTLTSLPFAARIAGEFIRRLSSVVSTPLFMFVLTNSIVVALLTTTKSAVLSGGAEAGDIHDAYVRSGENRVGSSDGEETIVFGAENDANSNSNLAAARGDHATTEPEEDSVTVPDVMNDPPPATKIYKRSKTEISKKQILPTLRRSETEKCRETVKSCEEAPFPEDHLTNEEFQKTIEAFIAKQLIFRRRESLAVVIHNQIPT